MAKMKKRILITVLFLVLCWGTMVTTDFILAMQAKKPIFSIYSEITDADRYKGLGYTIYIKYQGIAAMPEEELKDMFYYSNCNRLNGGFLKCIRTKVFRKYL